MNENFDAQEEYVVLRPVITVFGLGGAGSNVVDSMLDAGFIGVNFVVANTDAQSLEYSSCRNKIQLGINTTKGLGAGSSPEIGELAAEESIEEIKKHIKGSHMIVIVAGMGGGTGTGASAVVARIAKESGILVLAIVTKPFHFEGSQRMAVANNGITKLQQYVDTIVITYNQHLFRIANESTTLSAAFKFSDDVPKNGIKCITDVMVHPGLVNLDFADIRTVTADMGKAAIGLGEASGDNRSIAAAELAISNPLIDVGSMKDAKGVLINISGGPDMTLCEVDAAANKIKEDVGNNNTTFIFGALIKEELHGKMVVSVIITGIDENNSEEVAATQRQAQQPTQPKKPAQAGNSVNSAQMQSKLVELAKQSFVSSSEPNEQYRYQTIQTEQKPVSSNNPTINQQNHDDYPQYIARNGPVIQQKHQVVNDNSSFLSRLFSGFTKKNTPNAQRRTYTEFNIYDSNEYFKSKDRQE